MFFFVPIAKLNCTITKQMELIWISICVENIFVKTAKSCIIMMKKTFTIFLRSIPASKSNASKH